MSRNVPKMLFHGPVFYDFVKHPVDCCPHWRPDITEPPSRTPYDHCFLMFYVVFVFKESELLDVPSYCMSRSYKSPISLILWVP